MRFQIRNNLILLIFAVDIKRNFPSGRYAYIVPGDIADMSFVIDVIPSICFSNNCEGRTVGEFAKNITIHRSFAHSQHTARCFYNAIDVER